MKVVTTYCDVCDNVCMDKGGANHATIKWVSGDALDIHICDSCKDELHSQVEVAYAGYEGYKQEQLGLFRKILKALRYK